MARFKAGDQAKLVVTIPGAEGAMTSGSLVEIVETGRKPRGAERRHRVKNLQKGYGSTGAIYWVDESNLEKERVSKKVAIKHAPWPTPSPPGPTSKWTQADWDRFAEPYRPKSSRELPKKVSSKGYTATLECSDVKSAVWIIRRGGKPVGKLFDGSTYGWGRPHFSIRELVWAGPFPTGYPKNPEGALVFDGGPFDSHQKTIEAFAKQANELIAWRKKHVSTPTKKQPSVKKKKKATRTGKSSGLRFRREGDAYGSDPVRGTDGYSLSKHPGPEKVRGLGDTHYKIFFGGKEVGTVLNLGEAKKFARSHYAIHRDEYEAFNEERRAQVEAVGKAAETRAAWLKKLKRDIEAASARGQEYLFFTLDGKDALIKVQALGPEKIRKLTLTDVRRIAVY